MSRIADQYRTLEESAGWIDQSSRGRLRIGGQDGVAFLHALVTNDLQRLTRGDGVYAAYLTPQGRIIADLVLYHRGDFLLASVAPGVAGPLVARLDSVIFTEVVQVLDVSEALAEIFVTGRTAAEAAARALDISAGELETLPELAQRDAGNGFIARAGEAPLPAFTIVAPMEARAHLVARLGQTGAQPITRELADALRIAAGRPAFGIDMTAGTLPLEAGLLERAISTTKGCYVGQEIVIRILHRGGGRVARRLVTLQWRSSGGDMAPAPGSPLLVDGRAIGQLTSRAPALTGDGFIGLGYVARDLAIEGGSVTIGEGGPTAGITGFAR